MSVLKRNLETLNVGRSCLKIDLGLTWLLRTVATSGTFNVQTPRMEDSMPYADNGGILDIHVTSFQAAIDTLLSVARSVRALELAKPFAEYWRNRSNEHSNVISPMRHVVYSASSIADDLRAFEQRSPPERQGTDDESVKLGRERIEATLSNLVAAIKNHATSHGLSPVSLVDAAASHVSSAVIASINLVSLRKSTPAEREMERQREQAAESSGHGLGLLSAGSSPQSKTDRIRFLRGADQHGRNPSDASQWSSIGGSRLGGTTSDRSSNPSPQPPHTPNGINGSSEEGVDEAWEELKVCSRQPYPVRARELNFLFHSHISTLSRNPSCFQFGISCLLSAPVPAPPSWTRILLR